MPEPTEVHTLDLDQDDDGWDMGTCSCGGWECPPVPGEDLVADAFAEHVAAARAEDPSYHAMCLARIADLQDQLTALEETLATEAREYAAVEEMTTAMAAAIGWETPGETWLDKARNWRTNPDDLPGLFLERVELRDVVEALAVIDPAGDDGFCVICLHGAAHEPECPWLAARAYVERREAEGTAGGGTGGR